MAKAKDSGKYEKIECPHLIICEGLDTKLYMMWLLQSLTQNDARYENFQAVDGKGISDLPRFIKALPGLPNFRDVVKSIIIARDSEQNSKGASQSVQEVLKKSNFAVPSAPCEVALPTSSLHKVKTSYVLFPDINSDNKNGTLEDLCLKTLVSPDKEKVLRISNGAVESYEKQIGKLKRPHKNRLYAYLSLSDKFVGKKLGQSAEAKAFDFQSSDVKPLRDLLQTMLEG